MKFSQNTPVISPNTIGNGQVQAVRDVMAYGTAGKGYDAAVGALGQMAKVAKEQQDDMDAADHMSRRNVIMSNITKRLYGENGILTTGVGENAKGLSDRVTQVVQEEFNNGMKGANERVRRSMAGTFNENMGNYQRIAAQQEGREYVKVKEANYVANQNINLDRAISGYADNESVNFAVNDGLKLLTYRAREQGWTNAQYEQEKRKLVGNFIGGAIQTAIDNSDLTQADTLLTKYGGQMDQATKMKYDVKLKKNSDIKMSRDIGADLVKRFGGDKKKARDYLFNVLGNETVTVGGSNDRFVRIAQETAAIIRQKYPDASPNLEKYLYGQMMRETGWGKDPVALEYNNFAGLHGGAKGRKYADDHDYAKDYASFFTDGYHTQAIYATDGTDFARRLSNKLDGGSGWYEDRNYQGYGQTIMEAMADYEKKSAAGGVSFEKLDSDIDASGVQIDGAQPQTIGMINRAKQIYKNLFGRDDFWVSSVTGGHDDGTPHALGYKADVGGSALQESYENRIAFQQALQAEGIGANNEYDMPSKNSTGGHFDLDSRGTNWQTGEEFGGFKSDTNGHTKRKYSEAQLESIWRQYEAQWSDNQQAEAYEKKQKAQQYIDGLKGMSQSQVISYLEQIKAGENFDVFNSVKSAARSLYPDAFKESNSITGTRSSRSKGSKKIVGNSGETYTAAQIRRAQAKIKRYYNDDKITDAEQEQYDNAANILQDVGLSGSGDNLDSAEAFTVARQAWEQTHDYEKAHKWLRDIYNFTYNEATYYLDNLD